MQKKLRSAAAEASKTVAELQAELEALKSRLASAEKKERDTARRLELPVAAAVAVL